MSKQDAGWEVDWQTKEPRIRYGPGSPCGKGHFKLRLFCNPVIELRAQLY